MAWLKVDDNAPHHRKMLAAGDVACWLWICGLAYCQRHMTDGVITPEAVPFLGCTGWKAAVPKLVSAGLWVPDGSGYRVHDFLAWNDSAETRKQRIRDGNERVTRFRDRKKRDASVTGNATPTPTPQPTPQPTPTTNDVVRVVVAAPPAVMPPAEYDRLRRTHRHVGARLRVPNVLHSEFVSNLGGEQPDAVLVAWYGQLDEELERSKGSIGDVFEWLRPRFKALVGEQSKAADFSKWAPGGEFDRQIAGKA